MNLDPRTLVDLVRLGAVRFPERTAIERVSGPERDVCSYKDLWARARRGAAALGAAGLVPGDRVMLALRGGPEWAAAFFAIEAGGLVAVPIAPDTPPATLAAIAAHADARACVVRSKAEPLASALRRVNLLSPDDLDLIDHNDPRADRDGFSSTRAGDSLSNYVGGAPQTGDEGVPNASRDRLAELDGGSGASLDPESTALLCFTSGSTAHPRAVALSHRNLLSNVHALLSVGRAHPGDAFLSMLPLSHLFELVCGFLGPLACGARIVYAGAPLPNRILDALREEEITHALAVPALLDAFYQEVLTELVEAQVIDPSRRAQPMEETARRFRAESSPLEQDRMRAAIRRRIGARFQTLIVGGAALDPVWRDVFEPLGIELQIGYGLTEAGPIVSGGLASNLPPGSAGRSLPGVDVRLGDDDEILVRGPSVMQGYFKDPAATAAVLTDGWLHSGDHGRLDAKGFLFVTGRLKEVLVTSAGETLYPEEVEPYYASPLFAEHCVVAMPGPGGNDVPTLVIVPAAADARDEDLAHAVAGLRAAAPARCRVAGFVRHHGPLPKAALGKVKRRVLAETLRAQERTP